jgi:hypothetical protein
MVQLAKPPTDANSYVHAALFGLRTKNEATLRELIEQGTAKIAATASYAFINDLEPLISGYEVFFVPVEDSRTFANFYLQKLQRR